MARISKQTLTTAEQSHLISQLTDVLSRVNKDQANDFIFEFFGKEERMMIAKRLAIIALIHEKRPIHRIATHLHTSETTVKNLKSQYEQNRYSCTIKALTKNKIDYKKFVDLLDSILTVGGIMPYRNTPIRIPR
jgi:uncharacterized protein YerC